MEEHENINNKRRGKTMEEPYSDVRIERFKYLVRDAYQKGQRRYFSIIVDNEVVVPKTHDFKQYDFYKRYVYGHTKVVEVRMYFGKSPNFNRYIFRQQKASLSGVPDNNVNTIVKEAIEKERARNKVEWLERELSRKNKKLKQYKALDAELNKNKIDINQLMQMGLGAIIGFVQKRKSENQEKETNQQLAEPKQPEKANVEVEVQPAQPQPNGDQDLDELYNGLKGMSPKEVKNSLNLLKVLSNNPELKQDFLKRANEKRRAGKNEEKGK